MGHEHFDVFGDRGVGEIEEFVIDAYPYFMVGLAVYILGQSVSVDD